VRGAAGVCPEKGQGRVILMGARDDESRRWGNTGEGRNNTKEEDNGLGCFLPFWIGSRWSIWLRICKRKDGVGVWVAPRRCGGSEETN